MTQARTTPQPEPDDDWPALPAERTLPQPPSDSVLDLDEEELPEVPASDVPQVPDQPAEEATVSRSEAE